MGQNSSRLAAYTQVLDDLELALLAVTAALAVVAGAVHVAHKTVEYVGQEDPRRTPLQVQTATLGSGRPPRSSSRYRMGHDHQQDTRRTFAPRRLSIPLPPITVTDANLLTPIVRTWNIITSPLTSLSGSGFPVDHALGLFQALSPLLAPLSPLSPMLPRLGHSPPPYYDTIFPSSSDINQSRNPPAAPNVVGGGGALIPTFPLDYASHSSAWLALASTHNADDSPASPPAQSYRGSSTSETNSPSTSAGVNGESASSPWRSTSANVAIDALLNGYHLRLSELSAPYFNASNYDFSPFPADSGSSLVDEPEDEINPGAVSRNATPNLSPLNMTDDSPFQCLASVQHSNFSGLSSDFAQMGTYQTESPEPMSESLPVGSAREEHFALGATDDVLPNADQGIDTSIFYPEVVCALLQGETAYGATDAPSQTSLNVILYKGTPTRPVRPIREALAHELLGYFNAEVCHRIPSLDINISGSVNGQGAVALTKLHQDVFNEIENWNGLRSLKFEASDDLVHGNEVVQEFFADASREFRDLEKLEWTSGLEVFPKHWRGGMRTTPWPNLTSLSVRVPLSNAECLFLLQNCSNIRELVVDFSTRTGVTSGFKTSQKISMSQLNRLEIIASTDITVLLDTLQPKKNAQWHLRLEDQAIARLGDGNIEYRNQQKQIAHLYFPITPDIRERLEIKFRITNSIGSGI